VRGLLLLMLAGAAVLAAQQAAAQVDPAPDWFPPPAPEDQQNMIDQVTAAPTGDQRLAAFEGMIRQLESKNQYNVITGGQTFNDYSQHPRIKVWFHDPRRPGDGNNNWSDAAGAYQITSATYDDFAPKLGITDFSPASQDAIATAILKRTGAYDAIVSDDIAGALALASKRWASLPGSTAQQNPATQQAAMSVFDQWLANVTTV